MPFFGGLTLSGGGYCHATFTVREGRVAKVLHGGETEAILAPEAYCAPIVRGCVYQAERPGRITINRLWLPLTDGACFVQGPRVWYSGFW